MKSRALVMLIWIAAGGCTGSDSKSPLPADRSTAAGGPISAVATVGMVADLVRTVGGEHVQVTQVMGAGVDPHLYKATRDDVQRIMQGDIVF